MNQLQDLTVNKTNKMVNFLKNLLSVKTTLLVTLIYSFLGFPNLAFLITHKSNQINNLESNTLFKQRFSSANHSPLSTVITEIVIVDSAIKDSDTLIHNLSANTRVYYLNSNQDGVEQITQILSSHHNLQAIHILAHGTAGQLNLGSGRLNSLTFHSQTRKLQAWGQALAIDGDILLYGCDFAQGMIGKAAVKTLAQLTGADIAASNNYTGNNSLGGDWNLEVQVGKIESHPTLNYFAQSNYSYILDPTVPNPDLPSDTCNSQVDLMFILDESGSVSTTERELQRQSVRDTLQYLIDNNINSRAAIVAFTTTSRTLTSYVEITSATISTEVGSEGALELAIQSYGNPPSGSGNLTNWEAGFDEALDVVSATGSYPDALFFFTDGTINSGNSADRSPDDEADSFKTNGTHIYSIGIGGSVSGSDLYRLTDGDPTNPPGSLPGSEDYNSTAPNPVPADHVDVTNYSSLSNDLLNFFQEACLPSASLTKEFNADTIVPTEVSTLTFTITNISGDPVRSNINFTDEFPTPVIIADDDASSITNTCNGTLTDSSGGDIGIDDTGITLTGGSLALNQTSCQISVKVTSNLDVATATTYTNDSDNISDGNNINAENLDDDLIVNPFPVSSLAGDLIINEVLYRQTGSGASDNDEFIELFNASGSSLDLTGLKLVDGNLLATDNPNAEDENFSGSDRFYTFGQNTSLESGSLTLESGQYAVIWIGSKSNAVNNATGATFQAWLEEDPKLNNSGDDIWLYDTNTDLIDYVAYGINNAINARPDSSTGLWAQWDSSDENKLDNASTGQSISLTPNGDDGNTSACWEKTTIDESSSDSASTRCTNFLTTIDRDTSVINSSERITSVGANNNGANLILVKRITDINPNPNSIDFSAVVDDGISNSDDDDSNWENNFLQGQINVEDVQPGDEVEYTIYFLSNGGADASNVKFCDVIPDNTTMVESGYGFNTGISLFYNNVTTALSNDFDTDQGEFYSPNTNPPTFCQKVDLGTGDLVSINSGNNSSGAIVVELDAPLTYATGAGTPINSYGYIRFRVKVQ